MRCLSALLLLAPLLPAQSPAVLAGLATGTYFPLDVGDRWVYRLDDRFSTAQYQTWRIDRTVSYNGTIYAAFKLEGPGTFVYEEWFRTDTSGKIYVLGGSGDQLFFDPTGQSPSAQLQIASKGPGSLPGMGTFPDTISYTNTFPGNLEIERGVLVRGLGLLTSTGDMISGSSGGAVLIRTLVEASVAGGIQFPAPVAAVQLGIDSLAQDVTGKQAANCAIPCYFVACYIAGADPPGTYKPCSQVRVGLINWPANASRVVHLQLIAPDNSSAFDQTLTLATTPESVTFTRILLYSAPNQPFAPGAYQLTATTSDGLAQSTLTLRIQ